MVIHNESCGNRTMLFYFHRTCFYIMGKTLLEQSDKVKLKKGISYDINVLRTRNAHLGENARKHIFFLRRWKYSPIK